MAAQSIRCTSFTLARIRARKECGSSPRTPTFATRPFGFEHGRKTFTPSVAEVGRPERLGRQSVLR